MTIVTTPEANDPQIVYEPSRAIILAPSRANLGRAAAWGGVTALAVLSLLIMLDCASGLVSALATIGPFTNRRPYMAIFLAGTLGTVVATHPLLLGRSLVSPGKLDADVRYDQPP